MSPPARVVWIEIICIPLIPDLQNASPPARVVWIEMQTSTTLNIYAHAVATREGGVD